MTLAPLAAIRYVHSRLSCTFYGHRWVTYRDPDMSQKQSKYDVCGTCSRRRYEYGAGVPFDGPGTGF